MLWAGFWRKFSVRFSYFWWWNCGNNELFVSIYLDLLKWNTLSPENSYVFRMVPGELVISHLCWKCALPPSEGENKQTALTWMLLLLTNNRSTSHFFQGTWRGLTTCGCRDREKSCLYMGEKADALWCSPFPSVFVFFCICVLLLIIQKLCVWEGWSSHSLTLVKGGLWIVSFKKNIFSVKKNFIFLSLNDAKMIYLDFNTSEVKCYSFVKSIWLRGMCMYIERKDVIWISRNWAYDEIQVWK